MVTIKKIEYFETRNGKDCSEQIVYTFENVETCFKDHFKDSEQDSFDVLIKTLIKKTAKNSSILYKIIDDKTNKSFKIESGDLCLISI